MLIFEDFVTYFTLVRYGIIHYFRKNHFYLKIVGGVVTLVINDGRFPGEEFHSFTRDDIVGNPYPTDAAFITAMREIVMITTT